MPVSWVSLKAGIMSHFIIRSGSKPVPESQTLSVTSLDRIQQHSVTILLGQGQDASQPLPQPRSPPRNTQHLCSELLVSWRCLQCQDESIGAADPPPPPFPAHPSVAHGKEMAGAHGLPQPPPCAAACILPLWHCRIVPCGMQLHRPLPTEEARRSS